MYFNFVTDGSSNKQYNFIVNFFEYTKIVIFQLESQIISSIKYTAKELARYANEKANFWLHGRITKHISRTIDKALVMQSFWSIIGENLIQNDFSFMLYDSLQYSALDETYFGAKLV